MKKTALTILILVLTVCTVFGAVTCFAKESYSLRLSQSNLGKDYYVYVKLTENAGVWAATLEIDFDADDLALVGISFDKLESCISDETLDTINGLIANCDESPVKSPFKVLFDKNDFGAPADESTGTVAVLHFKAKTSGTKKVSVSMDVLPVTSASSEDLVTFGSSITLASTDWIYFVSGGVIVAFVVVLVLSRKKFAR